MNIKKHIFLYLFSILFSTIYLNANELRIITNEEPPTNYLDENQEIVGITVDVVKKLKEELKLDTQIEFMPWTKAYNIALEKPNIVIFTGGKTFERIKEGFHFIGPIVTKKHILFSKATKNIEVSTALDIKKQELKIGAMQNDWRSKYFKDKGLIVSDVLNHQENVNKLMLGKIDLLTSSSLEFPFIMKKANISMDKIKDSYTFKEFDSYIMISKETSRKDVKKWKLAFKKLQKTDFFEKTAKKWSEILDINLEYSKAKGFYKQ